LHCIVQREKRKEKKARALLLLGGGESCFARSTFNRKESLLHKERWSRGAGAKAGLKLGGSGCLAVVGKADQNPTKCLGWASDLLELKGRGSAKKGRFLVGGKHGRGDCFSEDAIDREQGRTNKNSKQGLLSGKVRGTKGKNQTKALQGIAGKKKAETAN